MTAHDTQQHTYRGAIGALLVAMILTLAAVSFGLATTPAQPIAPSAPAAAPAVLSTDPYLEYAPNTALVKLKPGVALTGRAAGAGGGALTTDAQSLDGLLQAFGATTAEPVFGDMGGTAARAGRPSRAGLERIYRVQWTAPVPVEHAVAALAADPSVEYAEPDYVARAARTPNDPEYATLWALPKINAPAAWDVTTGAPTVIIALVDSGVDTAHPDFAGRLWENDDPVNGADDDLNGKVDDANGWNVFANSNDLTDPNGHGSEVGGVAGAASDNGAGVAGMCWNCRLMFVNAMQANNVANYSDVAAAVQYAASNGAQVINLSLGGYADSAVLRDAVREAAITALIVGGAGNDDSGNPFYPAAYPEVLAVAGTDLNDQKAVFSNYGAWVDVSAPGKEIRTTTVGGYATSNGTSLAAPFVAGLAGLVKSQHPTWTPEQVRWQILNTAVNIDGVNPTRAGQMGRGRIDAGAALATDPQARAAVEGYAIDGQANARPAPGQTFQLVLNLRNLWLLADDLQGTLTSSDPYVASIGDASGAFGDIAPGQVGSNSGDPFGVTVAAGAPYNQQLQFTLNLSGAGGYSLVVPFTVQVRSGVETLGNTIYNQDTTWTSDKTYILNGSVIVNTDVTLTIQPGTLIKGNPGKFLRVDGTLIARGTAELPILFTTNSITNATWSGLRFTESAVDATYDAEGNYVAGSVLQHVELGYADVAANLSTPAPYIADSAFRSNGTSIQIGNSNNGGSPHIERNTFTGSGSAILLYGGQPLIHQNSFVGVTNAIGNNNTGGSSGSPRILENVFRNGSGTSIQIGGSPTIVGNVIQGNSGTAISISCCYSSPVIRDNVIVGNGGGISTGGLQLVDIEHNLVANNGTVCDIHMCNGGAAAVALDVQSSGIGQQYPALAYNPDQDEYLLTWSDTANAMYSIKAQRLATDGQRLGNEIRLGSGARSAIAYNTANHEYLAIWSDMMTEAGAMQRLTRDGAPIGAAIGITMYMSSNVRAIYQPVDNSYLVAWEKYSCEAGCYRRILARHVAADGTWLSDALTIGADVDQSDKSLGEIAYDPINQRALIAFRSTYQRNRVFGGWVVGNSAAFSSTVLSEDPVWGVQNIGLAFGSNSNKYFAVWDSDSGAMLQSVPIKGQLANADGTVSVSSTLIFSTSGQAYSPRVAYGSTPSEFFAVWAYNPTPQYASRLTQLYGLRLNSTGASAGAPILVSVPITGGVQDINMGLPAIVYNSQRNEYLIAWADRRTGVNSLWAQRISADGQLLDNAWTPADETNPANNFRISQSRGVRYNTIIQNTGNGIQLGGQAAGSVSIVNNNLFGNGTYDLYLAGGQAGTQNFTVDATNNFWNIDASQISNRIRDCTFDDNGCGTASSTVGKVAYDPVLGNPEQSAPAFMRDSSMSVDGTPQQVIGMQRGTVTVDFSAPMMTGTLPTASFHDSRRGTTKQVFSDTAQVMANDVLGRIWFGLNASMYGAGGTRMYDGRQWTTYTTANSSLGGGNLTAIYGAANGDVWFANSPMAGLEQAGLSQLQGSTWVTYANNIPGIGWIGNISAIGQDNQGSMWFGGSNGLYRYDGSSWRQFTTSDGIASNAVSRIVRDGRGRMWFWVWLPAGGSALSVFDGVNWTTYNMANGLPTNQFSSLFADSQGRVWVGLNWYNSNNRAYLAMYDGAGWHYYSNSDTNGLLMCDVNGIAEMMDGTLWFSSCGNLVTYDGVAWSTSGISGVYYPFTFDSRGNFWYNANGLTVRWGGANYAFTDGQWLSPTRFQAGYTFDANIAPGFYAVQTDNALDSEGMAAYAGSSASFQVDFGAGVTLDPPTPPQVTAQTNGSLGNLSAAWQSSSPNIDQYRYAIGTTPGARNVVGWTYLAGTSVTRNDLNLVQGQSYYVTVQVRNTSGLWSVNGVSNGVVGGQTPAPTPTPMAPDGESEIYLPAISRP